MSGVDQDEAKSASTDSFKTALVFNAIVFGAELAVFTLLRPYFPSIYQPRTYVPPKRNRIAPLISGGAWIRQFLFWPIAVLNSDYRAIKKANGLDAYFFVRYLRMMVKIFAPIWVISWAVLLPVTYVGTYVSGNDNGLDRFTFGNVQGSQSARYAAHVVLVWFFTIWIFYVIKNEMRHFILTRQKHLMDPERAGSVQANTILITGIPAKYLTPTALRKVFGDLPGGVRGVWVNRNLQSLPDTYERQLAACGKLEGAETALLNTRHKLLAKMKKKGQPVPEDFEVPADKRPTHKLGFLGLLGEKVDSIEWARNEIAATRSILEAARQEVTALAEGEGDEGVLSEELEDEGGADLNPLTAASGILGKRSKKTPRNGNDGDSDIEEDADGTAEANQKKYHLRADIGSTIAQTGRGVSKGVRGVGGQVGKVGKGIAETGKNLLPIGNRNKEGYPPLNSAFILFHKQIAAHLGAQVLLHHEPYRMSDRYLEVSPRDVIWGNLGLNPYETKVRLVASWGITAGLIILWAFPVAFVGAVSNVYSLCTTYSWLAWICTLPSIVVGIIQGILPPVLLAVLMMLLPIILRLLAQFEGIPKRSDCELSLMNRFFIFQVIHSFLIVTLAAGIIASLDDLAKDPSSIAGLLAENLPKASTFFLTYIILQGLAGTAGGFLQIVPLAIYYVKLFILGSTPRSVWGIKYGKRAVAWGTTWPGVTLLTVIALGYMIISPIINGLACFTFFMFYQLYKYLFLWTYDLSDVVDTGGLFFPRAIQHLFVGMYVQQICLCALFFLARDDSNNASAIPQGALMVVLIIFTAFFHIIINNSYGPLIKALPLSLADKMYATPDISALPKKEDGVELGKKDEEAINGKTSFESTAPIQPKGKGDSLVTEEEEYGFSHPAVSRPQRTVWIPQDENGGWEAEVRGCKEGGVDVSTVGAVMNEKGKVDVSGAPPDVRGWWEQNDE